MVLIDGFDNFNMYKIIGIIQAKIPTISITILEKTNMHRNPPSIINI